MVLIYDFIYRVIFNEYYFSENNDYETFEKKFVVLSVFAYMYMYVM